MKRFVLQTLVTALTMGLVACGDLSQDPLKGVDESIRNAKPPQTKPEIPRPVESDALLIVAPEVVSFKEGVQTEMSLQLRTLLPDYEGEINIVNMGAFAGASYNPQTGSFTWTPPMGSVMSGFFQEYVLQVEATANPVGKSGGAILFTKKDVHFIVQKVTTAPVIKSVTYSEPSFRENGLHTINIVVEDIDGGTGPNESPNILISNGTSKTSIAPYVYKMSARGNAVTKEWFFEYRVNLSGVELTDSRLDTIIELQAINRYGVYSAPTRSTVVVYTDFAGTAETTFEVGTEFVVGQKNVIPFTVFDPKGEAVVNVSRVRGFPADAQVFCKDIRKSWLNCRVEWTPDTKDAKKTFNSFIDVQYRNRRSEDSRVVNRTASFTYKTIDAAPADGTMPVPKNPDQGTPGPEEGGN